MTFAVFPLYKTRRIPTTGTRYVRQESKDGQSPEEDYPFFLFHSDSFLVREQSYLPLHFRKIAKNGDSVGVGDALTLQAYQ